MSATVAGEDARSVCVERERRGWSVIVHYPEGRQVRVGTYPQRFRAVEHAARLTGEDS